ncbi:hypothetical protein JAAARDRAFT_46045 [Jaapia argillacea MUCL 33604]|uniref:Uncharacterized protein n=1 Tax=Jaapia argillacea MUCL 33604 TaxID=933084 RepID=A0A067Q2B7_9AGAM|nr:hypothetical protein JAAARDRAFT_46045 [Jaapia argillacea MUCL 33604]
MSRSEKHPSPSEQIRQLWNVFEEWLSGQRAEMGTRQEEMETELIEQMHRKQKTRDIQSLLTEYERDKRNIAKVVEEDFAVRAQAEWKVQLAILGFQMRDWTDITEKEIRAVQKALSLTTGEELNDYEDSESSRTAASSSATRNGWGEEEEDSSYSEVEHSAPFHVTVDPATLGRNSKDKSSHKAPINLRPPLPTDPVHNPAYVRWVREAQAIERTETNQSGTSTYSQSSFVRYTKEKQNVSVPLPSPIEPRPSIKPVETLTGHPRHFIPVALIEGYDKTYEESEFFTFKFETKEKQIRRYHHYAAQLDIRLYRDLNDKDKATDEEKKQSLIAEHEKEMRELVTYLDEQRTDANDVEKNRRLAEYEAVKGGRKEPTKPVQPVHNVEPVRRAEPPKHAEPARTTGWQIKPTPGPAKPTVETARHLPARDSTPSRKEKEPDRPLKATRLEPVARVGTPRASDMMRGRPGAGIKNEDSTRSVHAMHESKVTEAVGKQKRGVADSRQNLKAAVEKAAEGKMRRLSSATNTSEVTSGRKDVKIVSVPERDEEDRFKSSPQVWRPSAALKKDVGKKEPKVVDVPEKVQEDEERFKQPSPVTMNPQIWRPGASAKKETKVVDVPEENEERFKQPSPVAMNPQIWRPAASTKKDAGKDTKVSVVPEKVHMEEARFKQPSPSMSGPQFWRPAAPAKKDVGKKDAKALSVLESIQGGVEGNKAPSPSNGMPEIWRPATSAKKDVGKKVVEVVPDVEEAEDEDEGDGIKQPSPSLAMPQFWRPPAIDSDEEEDDGEGAAFFDFLVAAGAPSGGKSEEPPSLPMASVLGDGQSQPWMMGGQFEAERDIRFNPFNPTVADEESSPVESPVEDNDRLWQSARASPPQEVFSRGSMAKESTLTTNAHQRVQAELAAAKEALTQKQAWAKKGSTEAVKKEAAATEEKKRVLSAERKTAAPSPTTTRAAAAATPAPTTAKGRTRTDSLVGDTQKACSESIDIRDAMSDKDEGKDAEKQRCEVVIDSPVERSMTRIWLTERVLLHQPQLRRTASSSHPLTFLHHVHGKLKSIGGMVSSFTTLPTCMPELEAFPNYSPYEKPYLSLGPTPLANHTRRNLPRTHLATRRTRSPPPGYLDANMKSHQCRAQWEVFLNWYDYKRKEKEAVRTNYQRRIWDQYSQNLERANSLPAPASYEEKSRLFSQYKADLERFNQKAARHAIELNDFAWHVWQMKLKEKGLVQEDWTDMTEEERREMARTLQPPTLQAQPTGLRAEETRGRADGSFPAAHLESSSSVPTHRLQPTSQPSNAVPMPVPRVECREDSSRTRRESTAQPPERRPNPSPSRRNGESTRPSQSPTHPAQQSPSERPGTAARESSRLPVERRPESSRERPTLPRMSIAAAIPSRTDRDRHEATTVQQGTRPVRDRRSSEPSQAQPGLRVDPPRHHTLPRRNDESSRPPQPPPKAPHRSSSPSLLKPTDDEFLEHIILEYHHQASKSDVDFIQTMNMPAMQALDDTTRKRMIKRHEDSIQRLAKKMGRKMREVVDEDDCGWIVEDLLKHRNVRGRKLEDRLNVRPAQNSTSPGDGRTQQRPPPLRAATAPAGQAVRHSLGEAEAGPSRPRANTQPSAPRQHVPLAPLRSAPIVPEAPTKKPIPQQAPPRPSERIRDQHQATNQPRGEKARPTHIQPTLRTHRRSPSSETSEESVKPDTVFDVLAREGQLGYVPVVHSDDGDPDGLVVTGDIARFGPQTQRVHPAAERYMGLVPYPDGHAGGELGYRLAVAMLDRGMRRWDKVKERRHIVLTVWYNFRPHYVVACRNQWRDFSEGWLAHHLQERDAQRAQVFQELDQNIGSPNSDSFSSNNNYDDLLHHGGRDGRLDRDKDAVERALDDELMIRARQEWDKRLQDAGLRIGDWSYVTQRERITIEKTLGLASPLEANLERRGTKKSVQFATHQYDDDQPPLMIPPPSPPSRAPSIRRAPSLQPYRAPLTPRRAPSIISSPSSPTLPPPASRAEALKRLHDQAARAEVKLLRLMQSGTVYPDQRMAILEAHRQDCEDRDRLIEGLRNEMLDEEKERRAAELELRKEEWRRRLRNASAQHNYPQVTQPQYGAPAPIPPPARYDENQNGRRYSSAPPIRSRTTSAGAPIPPPQTQYPQRTPTQPRAPGGGQEVRRDADLYYHPPGTTAHVSTRTKAIHRSQWPVPRDPSLSDLTAGHPAAREPSRERGISGGQKTLPRGAGMRHTNDVHRTHWHLGGGGGEGERTRNISGGSRGGAGQETHDRGGGGGEHPKVLPRGAGPRQTHDIHRSRWPGEQARERERERAGSGGSGGHADGANRGHSRDQSVIEQADDPPPAPPSRDRHPSNPSQSQSQPRRSRTQSQPQSHRDAPPVPMPHEAEAPSHPQPPLPGQPDETGFIAPVVLYRSPTPPPPPLPLYVAEAENDPEQREGRDRGERVKKPKKKRGFFGFGSSSRRPKRLSDDEREEEEARALAHQRHFERQRAREQGQMGRRDEKQPREGGDGMMIVTGESGERYDAKERRKLKKGPDIPRERRARIVEGLGRMVCRPPPSGRDPIERSRSRGIERRRRVGRRLVDGDEDHHDHSGSDGEPGFDDEDEGPRSGEEEEGLLGNGIGEHDDGIMRQVTQSCGESPQPFCKPLESWARRRDGIWPWTRWGWGVDEVVNLGGWLVMFRTYTPRALERDGHEFGGGFPAEVFGYPNTMMSVMNIYST